MKRRDRLFVEVVVGLVLITAAVYFFVGVEKESLWPAGRVDVDSGTRLVMGTLAHIIAVAPDTQAATEAIDAAFEQLNSIEKLMSVHKADSEISRLNRSAANDAVRVSKHTFEVLQKALEFSRLSAGAFDITVGPLVELWASAEVAGAVPSDGDLEKTRSLVGYEKLLLDANETRVRFAVEGMKLDLGGIAKGYAIDKAVEAMKLAGATGGMIDVGGDVRCFGAPPGDVEKWFIGLQDSRRSAEGNVSDGRLLMILHLPDMAVATSGDYRRFAVIDGKIYSHIIDTSTGLASDQLSSITIICPSATDADALTTAVSVMGKEKGLALIESLPDTEAILITAGPQYELFKTGGAGQYIEK